MQHNNRQNQFDRNRYYKLLRVGKQELGWDDEFYYGIWLPIQGATLKDGRYSASTLSNTQLFSAVEAMKSKGFKVKYRSGNKRTRRITPQRRLADDAQSRKIRALWLELHNAGKVRNPSEESLCAYVKRMTNVDALQWLSSTDASGVIEALKKWLKREAKPAASAATR
ncbi:MAG: regulatory protein GemA [Methylobacter sp.]|uniref:gp16 family protein n=1 Tax=Methylobacter sp. TaxID=2051955 RepID=UPI00258551E6|nr:regulatory protein GemA [Methylobacter sp.]MCL7422528.1 regulatory protein GemA [Methylobacter sp.]